MNAAAIPKRVKYGGQGRKGTPEREGGRRANYYAIVRSVQCSRELGSKMEACVTPVSAGGHMKTISVVEL